MGSHGAGGTLGEVPLCWAGLWFGNGFGASHEDAGQAGA